MKKEGGSVELCLDGFTVWCCGPLGTFRLDGDISCMRKVVVEFVVNLKLPVTRRDYSLMG